MQALLETSIHPATIVTVRIWRGGLIDLVVQLNHLHWITNLTCTTHLSPFGKIQVPIYPYANNFYLFIFIISKTFKLCFCLFPIVFPHLLTLTLSSLISIFLYVCPLSDLFTTVFLSDGFFYQNLGSLEIFHGPGLYIKHHGSSPSNYAQIFLVFRNKLETNFIPTSFII